MEGERPGDPCLPGAEVVGAEAPGDAVEDRGRQVELKSGVAEVEPVRRDGRRVEGIDREIVARVARLGPAFQTSRYSTNDASIMRLIGAVLFEQNDEWQTSSRYMMVEAFAQIDKEEIDPILSITTKAA